MARRAKLADGTLGDWQHITYAQAWAQGRSIAQALIERGLNAERPVAILSENSLEHAQLAVACLIAGVPFVPVSPPYSLVSQDYDKLRHVLRTVTPGMVFAADATRYGRAIESAVDAGIEVVLTEEPIWVEADENQIRQVLWNLATNGLRAMSTAGCLELAAGYVEDRRGAYVAVRDEGVGIPADEVDGVFQPFRSTFERGTGLGLAIVHRIVSDYGGTIQLSSTVGVGTTFRVTLPVEMASRADVRGESHAARTGEEVVA